MARKPLPLDFQNEIEELAQISNGLAVIPKLKSAMLPTIKVLLYKTYPSMSEDHTLVAWCVSVQVCNFFDVNVVGFMLYQMPSMQ